MFITLEGPEGSGKTTAVDAAVKALEQMGYEIVRTREPGGTPIAEYRKILQQIPRRTPPHNPPRTSRIPHNSALHRRGYQ